MSRRRWVVLVCAALLVGTAFVLSQRGCAPERPRTIVLLTIDTCRWDHAGFLAPGWPDIPGTMSSAQGMPRLGLVAREGLRFTDARTPVPLTLPAHVTMFTGMPPAATGVRVNAYGRLPGPEERGFPLLAEKLKAAGWRTGAFVSAEPLAGSHGLGAGFEVYDDTTDAAGPEAPGYVDSRPGPETVAHAVAWLRALPQDAHAFLWVHVFEPHAPYLGSYANDVRAADEAAGMLLDGLAAAGRADAAFLATSDHGEMLDELGELTHGHLLGDAVLRVPFLLRAPGVAPALRSDPVDLADVAPTLAGLAGIAWDTPAGPFAGRDLLAGAAPADRVRVAESLFSHQRFRWAQLVAAVDGKGTLIDAGKDRTRWLPLAPWGRAQTSAEVVREAPQHLVDALAAYKRGEVAARMRPGDSSGGYGTSAPAVPFLTPEENGRLPDPYASIPRAHELDLAMAIVRVLRTAPDPRRREAVERTLASLRKDDPENPEVLYAAGLLAEARGVEALNATPPQPERAKAELAVAEATYGQAFERGRADAATLFRWCRVNAFGREAVCLARLKEMGRRVVWDAPLWTLKSQLHRTLGEQAQAPETKAAENAEAAEACRKALEAARNARERVKVEEVCVKR